MQHNLDKFLDMFDGAPSKLFLDDVAEIRDYLGTCQKLLLDYMKLIQSTPIYNYNRVIQDLQELQIFGRESLPSLKDEKYVLLLTGLLEDVGTALKVLRKPPGLMEGAKTPERQRYIDEFKDFFDRLYTQLEESGIPHDKNYLLSSLMDPSKPYKRNQSNRDRYIVALTDDDKEIIKRIKESVQYKKNQCLADLKKLEKDLTSKTNVQSSVTNLPTAMRSYWLNIGKFVLQGNVKVSRNIINKDAENPKDYYSEKRIIQKIDFESDQGEEWVNISFTVNGKEGSERVLLSRSFAHDMEMELSLIDPNNIQKT